ncbi:MAG TPA: hypothetical protein DCM28_07170 [Phycisphaerales bacterium]|nr:hypothetical protein [Phycisphaerales bacterium]
MRRSLCLLFVLLLLVGSSGLAHAGVRDAVSEQVVAGEGWTPITFMPTIEPGSVMDLSHTVDAPAGKYGRIIIDKDGHFATQKNNQRIRFYGNNLCFSANILPSDQCKSLARTFRMMGYNTVRFHHFDREITDHESGDSTKLDENMDRLDQLFYEMKQQGMYITIDMFVSRIFGKNEVAGFEKIDPTSFKALMMVNDEAFNSWAAFTRNLLNHVNPYTKLAWKDDPALFALCMTNENNATQTYRRSMRPVKDLVDAAFEKYLQKQGKSDVSGDDRKAWRTQFDADIQLRTFERCKKVVRDLGCKAFLTDANMLGQYHVTPARQAMDFVDSHGYWDHPQFAGGRWGLPEKYRNTTAMSEACPTPRTIMGARQFGKPYMITEFNFTYPNRYRAEAGPIMGAYAALQDWDGLYRFAYAHHSDALAESEPMHRFDTVKDPMMWLSERIIIDCFRRNKVEPASSRIAYAVTQTDMRNPKSGSWNKGQFDNAFTKLGLAVQIGSYDARDKANTPQNVDATISTDGSVGLERQNFLENVDAIKTALGTGKVDTRKGHYTSQTGQIVMHNTQGEMSIHTPQLACAILKAESKIQLGQITLENKDILPVVVYLAATDDKPLQQSKRVLVLHLSDVQNTGNVFATDKRQLLKKVGVLPLLARDSAATLGFSSDHASQLKAFAIDCSGKRITAADLKTDGSQVHMKLNTKQGNQAVLAYELIVE